MTSAITPVDTWFCLDTTQGRFNLIIASKKLVFWGIYEKYSTVVMAVVRVKFLPRRIFLNYVPG